MDKGKRHANQLSLRDNVLNTPVKGLPWPTRRKINQLLPCFTFDSRFQKMSMAVNLRIVRRFLTTWAVGRNGLWHGGIHITNASAPWCDLGGPFAGLQPLRNMADGEVVAYRVCSDLKAARWWGKPVPHACSFVLVRHYVQPGETEQSGLTFYTLYMNLAPWNAYSQGDTEHWSINVRCGLNAFAD